MCIDKRTHTHTPLGIHITVFVSTPTSTTTPRVTCAVALPCTISTRCNGWCDIPAERGSDTGDHVQSVDLLHVGVTKQLGPEHGADHNGRKHRALVSCSSDLLRDLSPLRICGSEVHKAERHAPIEMVEPAVYADIRRWDRNPEIDAVLSVCLAHLSRIFWIHGAKVRVHACGGELQNHFLRKLVDPCSSDEVELPRNTHALREQNNCSIRALRSEFFEGNCSYWCTCGAQNPDMPVCTFMLGTSAMSSPKSDSSLSTAAISSAPPGLALCTFSCSWGLNGPFEQKLLGRVIPKICCLGRVIPKTLHST